MTDKQKRDFKIKLKEKALEILTKRNDASVSAMTEAQLTANEEGKSSVGDKYETGRAMAQIERDIHAKQVETVQREIAIVQQTNINGIFESVQTGAFLKTKTDDYFFIAGLGAVDVGKSKIFFLSINSPIGKNLAGSKAGDVVEFNGKKIFIEEIF